MSLWQVLAQIDGWADAHTPPDKKKPAGGMSADRFKELMASHG